MTISFKINLDELIFPISESNKSPISSITKEEQLIHVIDIFSKNIENLNNQFLLSKRNLKSRWLTGKAAVLNHYTFVKSTLVCHKLDGIWRPH